MIPALSLSAHLPAVLIRSRLVVLVLFQHDLEGIHPLIIDPPEGHAERINQVVEELLKVPTIACTKCRYCVEECPKNILIPDVFAAYNEAVQFGVNDVTRRGYNNALKEHGSPADCIKCGKCEAQCPQHLNIRELLVKVNEEFK